MTEKKKKIIYFIIILVMTLAFITFYSLDNNIAKAEGDDAFSVISKPFKAALNDKDEEPADSTASEESFADLAYEKIQVFTWEKNDIDSLQIFSQRKNFTLINHGPKNWSIRSARLNEKIPKANNAIFKLLNVFTHLTSDNKLTRDYSELAKYFDYPICTITASFKNGTKGKLTFIRIAELNKFTNETEMKTWLRVNKETVVYATSYNTLERFLVNEEDFLKTY